MKKDSIFTLLASSFLIINNKTCDIVHMNIDSYQHNNINLSRKVLTIKTKS